MPETDLGGRGALGFDPAEREDISGTLPEGRWALVREGAVVAVETRDPAGRFPPVLEVVDLRGVPDVDVGWTRAADGAGFAPPATPDAPPPVSPRLVAVSLMRERLEAAGLWDAAVAVLTRPDNAATMLKLLTLAEGVAADDPEANALLAGIGADPAAILAPA